MSKALLSRIGDLSTAIVLFSIGLSLAKFARAEELSTAGASRSSAAYHGPVDVAVFEDTRLAVTVNQLSSTLSLIDLTDGTVLGTYATGDYPMEVHVTASGQLLVPCRDAGTLDMFRFDGRALVKQASVEVGGLPVAASVGPDSQRAFVSLYGMGQVAEVDLAKGNVLRTIEVGRWPKSLALTPDGRRLAIGLAGESRIAILDVASGEELFDSSLSGGINFGKMALAADGTHVYFPWMIYRTNPITPRDIRRGWVLASRIARVNLQEEQFREAMSLDVPGEAVADPYGMGLTPDQRWLVCTSSGTHEMLVYQVDGLPMERAGGPGDLIDTRLQNDHERFFRVPLGGRPMGLQTSRDNQTVWVANYLNDSLQRIDLQRRAVVQQIRLNSLNPTPAQQSVHRGRAIFYDASRSLDQWYSCHSCHLDGGTNAKAMDTWNDGSELTTKTVLPLYNILNTAPWTWHGWQEDLDESLQNSFVSTMQGSKISPQELEDLRNYLATLTPPPNPYVKATPAGSIEAGRKIFEAAGCVECHAGELLTDGQIHDVGLGSRDDAYDGFNTPSLIGVHLKPRLLHDGRSKSLRHCLENWHRPSELGTGKELTDDEFDRLIEYLQSL